jgi:hypothetical protein
MICFFKLTVHPAHYCLDPLLIYLFLEFVTTAFCALETKRRKSQWSVFQSGLNLNGLRAVRRGP